MYDDTYITISYRIWTHIQNNIMMMVLFSLHVYTAEFKVKIVSVLYLNVISSIIQIVVLPLILVSFTELSSTVSD